MKKPESYDDMTELNKCRDLLDTIGKDTLEKIAHRYLDLLETSVAIYEVDGGYATALFTSSYCNFLDGRSRALCDTDDNQEALDSGKWLCHESCWTEASRVSIETGKPYNLSPCAGEINIYAVPIRADERIIGSINFGYGTPPADKETIDELAREFKVESSELFKAASEYRPRSDDIIEAAKKHIHLAAELIGELYLRKKTEDRLKQKLDEVERMNKLVVARELKMEEMRNQIKWYAIQLEENIRKLVKIT